MPVEFGPGSRHPIPIRHPEFQFAPDIPRHWAGGNAFASHLFNATQLSFPEGERFFIRAVRDVLPRIDDPALVRQARAFAGQEAVHGKEHERYFENLRAQGYRIDAYLRRFGRFVALLDRLPASLRVAMTAALEHYTATLGYFALSNRVIEDFHPTMRSLIYWHAAEEVEHKAVAFDVMQAAGVGYATRIFAFFFATLAFFAWVAAGTRMLMRQDGLTRREGKAMRADLRGRTSGALVNETGRRIVAYLRRDFHPNQSDDLARAHARLAEIGLAASAT